MLTAWKSELNVIVLGSKPPLVSMLQAFISMSVTSGTNKLERLSLSQQERPRAFPWSGATTELTHKCKTQLKEASRGKRSSLLIQSGSDRINVIT
jgi:hypothetical protein